MIVKLPNGLVDGSDLFDHVVIDEIRGKQQNYLANRELVVGNIGHIPKILEDLVKSIETEEGLQWKGQIKDAIWNLTAGDLETILVKIREKTYGPRFYFEAHCDHCGHVNKNQRLDLDTLELDKMEPKDIFDEKRLELTLEKSKKVVVLKPLYLKDILETLKIAKDKHDSLVTCIIGLSVKSVDGSSANILKEIENLPAMDLQAIQDKMEQVKIEGTIDTNVEMDCSNCSKEFELKLDVFNSDFFAPTKASSSMNT